MIKQGWTARRLKVAFATVALLLAGAVAAQGFPERPVTLIVPWPAGGSTDIVMRALADSMTKHMGGQRVIIDNKPGASGTIGPGGMVNARPDGYTIAQMPITVLRIPHMQKVSFDPLTDFTWIIGVTGYTFGVVVRADSPWKTWAEFLAYAKANPEKVSYGSPGTGTTLHITMEEIAAREGIKWLHVPFQGNADATAALAGGHISASADSTGWAELIDSGRFRLLVTWGSNRTKRWPQVPTLKELGHGIVSTSPFGIAGPKGMDPKIVKALHDIIKKAMEDPAYIKTIDRFDQEPWYLNSEDYARYVRETWAYEKAAIERLGLAKK
jgi:tripartite-type tricarboxylate transporter receptor subunit TctC